MELGRVVILGLLLTTVFSSLPSLQLRTTASPGTILVPQDYPTIQEAVNAAVAGDSILVSTGTYQGNVTITKSLNLTGVSQDTTIIDSAGSAPGINITGTSNVWISGFTVRNTGFFYDGIIVASSNTVTITNNRIQASTEVNGVYIFKSNLVTVRNNTITRNLYGARVQSSISSLIQKNNFTANTIGIGIFNSTGDDIEDNILRLGESGLFLWTGSTDSVVERNLIANNTAYGISLRDSKRHLVRENNIEFNQQPSGAPATGIGIQNSTLNTFYHNNLRDNDYQMFAVFPSLGDITSNTWNSTVAGRTEGNFWSDYTGADDGSNGRTSGDGIGDTNIPHPCPNGGQPCSASGGPGVDLVPLMSPWQPPALNVTASAVPLSGFPPLQVTFTGSAVGGTPPYTYFWDFGDGSTSGSQNATHQYGVNGTVLVTLTGTDSLGASRSDSLVITVLVRVQLGGLAVRVVDVGQQPVSGANVTFVSQPAGQRRLSQIANDQGLTAFASVRSGSYELQASSPGYETATRNVVVQTNSTRTETIVLSRLTPADNTLLIVAAVAAALVVLVGVGFFYRRKSKKGIRKGRGS